MLLTGLPDEYHPANTFIVERPRGAPESARRLARRGRLSCAVHASPAPAARARPGASPAGRPAAGQRGSIVRGKRCDLPRPTSTRRPAPGLAVNHPVKEHRLTVPRINRCARGRARGAGGRSVSCSAFSQATSLDSRTATNRPRISRAAHHLRRVVPHWPVSRGVGAVASTTCRPNVDVPRPKARVGRGGGGWGRLAGGRWGGRGARWAERAAPRLLADLSLGRHQPLHLSSPRAAPHARYRRPVQRLSASLSPRMERAVGRCRIG